MATEVRLKYKEVLSPFIVCVIGNRIGNIYRIVMLFRKAALNWLFDFVGNNDVGSIACR